MIAALTPKPDVVFNALHGRFGEDGTIQGVLDCLGIPYTHSGVRASALAMDKAGGEGAVPLSWSACRACAASVDRRTGGPADPLPLPYVVKPVNEGSSVGVNIVEPGDNRRAEIVRDWHFGPAMVEEYVPGRELTVGVLEDRALAVTESCGRRNVSTTIMRNTRRAGRAMSFRRVLPDAYHAPCEGYRARGASGAGLPRRHPLRFSLRRHHGEPGRLVLLEMNTQPGLTPTSLLPEQAALCGHGVSRSFAPGWWRRPHAAREPVRAIR